MNACFRNEALSQVEAMEQKLAEAKQIIANGKRSMDALISIRVVATLAMNAMYTIEKDIQVTLQSL